MCFGCALVDLEERMNKLVAAVGSILDAVFNNFDKIPLVILRTSHFLRTESEKRLLELGLDPEQRSPFWGFFVKSFSVSFFSSKKTNIFFLFFLSFSFAQQGGLNQARGPLLLPEGIQFGGHKPCVLLSFCPVAKGGLRLSHPRKKQKK